MSNIDFSKLETAAMKAAKAAKASEQAALKLKRDNDKLMRDSLKASAEFTSIQNLTPSQYSVFVEEQIQNFSNNQKPLMRFLIKVAVDSLRSLPENDDA